MPDISAPWQPTTLTGQAARGQGNGHGGVGSQEKQVVILMHC